MGGQSWKAIGAASQRHYGQGHARRRPAQGKAAPFRGRALQGTWDLIVAAPDQQCPVLPRCKARAKTRQGPGEAARRHLAKENRPARYKDHPLSGEWSHFRDCHIKPNWLLIYKVDGKVDGEDLYLVCTGTHSDLF